MKTGNFKDVYYNLKYFFKKRFPNFYFFIRACRGYLFFLTPIIRRKKMPGFYAKFVRKGDLCFDIGAHAGLITGIFLELGAKVVAVEPQPLCHEITKKYGSNKNLVTINKGVASRPGSLYLTVMDNCNSISTMSERWRTKGRFSEEYKSANVRSILVSVVTLDYLIAEYGLPKFCKIDVEGFEKEVLKGLTKSIPYISFEFMKEFLDDAKFCVDYLETLGKARFNFSLKESTKLFFDGWVSSEELFVKLKGIKNKDLWGDIYIKMNFQQ